MRLAISVCDEQIAPTLGQSAEFILLEEQSEERVTCTGKIPIFLKEYQVECLICNGIGNCMLDLLTAMGIQVIPGIEGDWQEAVIRYHAGNLRAGKNYSCTDHGKSCGACSGCF